MENIVVLDYGSGNLRSVAHALQQVAGTEQTIQVTSAISDIDRADRIVVPGQGSFNQLSEVLFGNPDLRAALQARVVEQGRPYLGICLGMQILADTGHEFGIHPGLGWIKGNVRKLQPADDILKIPHMGWNDVEWRNLAHPLSASAPKQDFYFAHSYEFHAEDSKDILAHCQYGGAVAAALVKDNIAGLQAHPEKSGKSGLEFLRRFLEWMP